MKKLLTLCLTFLSLTASAENWLNDSKILSSSSEAHSLKKECERISGEKCYELGSYPSSVYSRGQIEVDDYSKPNYTKSQIEPCDDQAECDLIFASKACPSDRTLIKNYDQLQVYCSKLIGYEKKSENTIVLDQAKVQVWQAQETAKAQAAQGEDYIQLALKKIACGERVIAKMVVRNIPKNLSPAQIAQMNTIYAPIKGLLETASLVTAKEFILNAEADGTLITEADKVDLAAETQQCIDLN